MTDKGKEMVNIAEASLKYWNEITKCLVRKMSLHGKTNKNGNYKLYFVHENLPYNHDALSIVRNIFSRNSIELTVEKFKITIREKYAYVLTAQFH